MKKLLLALLLAATPALAQAPATPPAAPARGAVPDVPHNWATIVMTANINRGADEAWRRIKGDDYCAFITYLGMNDCVLTVGKGEVGTNRRLNGRIDELLVAKTGHSYTYAQPTSPIFYHGTLAVEPIDATHTKILYNLMYDIAPLETPEKKAADRAARSKRFSEALDAMKAMAEAQ